MKVLDFQKIPFFLDSIEKSAKEIGLEIKEDTGQILWPVYKDDGSLSEWSAIYVRQK